MGAFPIGHALRASRRGYVLPVNYHVTPSAQAANFERHLEFHRRHFENASSVRLDRVLAGVAAGPAILLAFDDGYRDNYEIAAPLLEKHGFTGWFFVSSGRHRDGAARTVDGEKADDFMSFAEMRDLIARGHVVGCHSHSHRRLGPALDAATLAVEIVESRKLLQDALSDPVDDFCWVGGEEWSYSAPAARVIERAGYRRAFGTNCGIVTARTDPFAIERTNIEAHWPLSQVRFGLSGLMQLAYGPKRRRVAAKLARDLRS